jgi:hemerythrin
MAFLTWDEDFSVKIKSIDEQHNKLIELINNFYENIESSSNNDNILKLIGGLKDYTQIHFATEEKYMLRHNYSDYNAHKKEHDMFVSKIRAIEEKIRQGKLVVSFEITGFLKDWLKNHIQITDKKYSSFFIENGVK